METPEEPKTKACVVLSRRVDCRVTRLGKKRTVCSCRALNTVLSVWEVFARSCKWISDLGNNMFVHSLGDWSVGVVQVQSSPTQL